MRLRPREAAHHGHGADDDGRPATSVENGHAGGRRPFIRAACCCNARCDDTGSGPTLLRSATALTLSSTPTLWCSTTDSRTGPLTLLVHGEGYLPGVPEPQVDDKADAVDEPDGGDTFVFFSLEGDRFDARGMPADAGREVAAYRDALVQIAVDLWKRAHPDRRAPNGFADAFDLRLIGVKRGSAQPQLVLDRPVRGVSDEDWAEWVQFYEQARDLATERVHEVDDRDAVPPDMRPQVRKALSRVGATLDGEERIRLGGPGSGKRRAVLTPRVREVLRRKDVEEPEAPRPVSAVGVLSEYDGEKLSFILRTTEGPRILCLLEHFNEPLARNAREHLALDGVTAADVRVQGETLDDEGKVRRIFNVHALEVVWTVPEKVIVHRVRSLTSLKPGWLGPGSDAPAEELGALLDPLVSDIAALGLPVTIVPSASGSVVLEWRAGHVEFTAEVRANSSLLLVADNVATDELAEANVPFDADLLRRFLTTGAME